MKKFVFAVFATALGLVVISCEADSISDTTLHTKNIKASTDNVTLNLPDRIPQNNFTTTSDGDGPGDEPLIIIPPKRPK